MALIWHELITKSFCCPQRYILAFLLFLATINSHTHITLLSTALPEMVAVEIANVTDCINPSRTSEIVVESPRNIYYSDEKTQGIILSSFYLGYIVTYLPGGFFTDELGRKSVFGLSVLGSTICTLTTPFIIYFKHGNLTMLIVFRILAGAFEGLVFPAMNYIHCRWIPKEDEWISLREIRRAGGLLGTIISYLLGGYMMSIKHNWSSIFYLFGTMGIVWFCLWQVFGFSSPDTHPFISESEVEYLNHHLIPQKQQWKKIPWSQVLSSVPFWMLIVGEIGHNWGWYLVLTQLPRYLKGVLQFTTAQAAVWSSVPFCFYWFCSVLFGNFSHYLISREYFSATTVRKLYCVIGALGSGIFMLLVSYSACDGMMVVAWFIVAMSFMSAYSASVQLTVYDLSPTFGNTLVEIVDAFGLVSGMMVPYVVGIIASNHRIHEWRYIFWISFYVYCSASCAYLIFATSEVAPWDGFQKSA